jgi:UDP-N-acetylglucosamine--N-acetylmuramyl-(pentapeptide) pyrophosphoryl-undecaprenol N-acetylglucosamine transferase
MNIVFVGGGSLGPVTPLLAVARVLKKQEKAIKFAWIGTPDGPERGLIEKEQIPFFGLGVAKWPRYPSFQWFTFPFQWLQARLRAKELMQRLHPSALLTAGGFTAVPVVQAAAAKGIPCVTHQLDFEPGLTNRLIAGQCVSVTTSFEYAQRPFGDRVTDEPLPTPVRYTLRDLPDRTSAARAFGLNPHQSILLVYGGGQGAEALNQFIERTLDTWLRFTQIIHVTGQRKAEHLQRKQRHGYVVRPLLQADEMLQAHAAADVEVIRGGIGGLSEVAALKKAALVVPMPGSHQEANARAFEEQSAVLVFDQTSPSFDDDVLTSVKLLLQDRSERIAMGERAHAFFATDDGTTLAKRLLQRLSRI